MDWNFTGSSVICDLVTTQFNNATLDTGTTTATWDLPDPLIDWLPYKWKKYIPTWHLVRSYK